VLRDLQTKKFKTKKFVIINSYFFSNQDPFELYHNICDLLSETQYKQNFSLSQKESETEKIHQWIKDIVERKIEPISIGSKKPYKEWTVSELLTFRYPFSIGNTEYRSL